MTANGWFQIFLFFGFVLLVTKPLGIFLYRVFEGKSTFLDPVLRPIEKLVYRVCGIDETKGNGLEGLWRRHAALQRRLFTASLSDRAHTAVAAVESAEDSAISPPIWRGIPRFLSPRTPTGSPTFPETTMSYFTQMAGLAYHNFVSAAVGVALAIAVIRGVARKESKTIGNFWVDTTRALLWVFLPLCILGGLVWSRRVRSRT